MALGLQTSVEATEVKVMGIDILIRDNEVGYQSTHGFMNILTVSLDH